MIISKEKLFDVLYEAYRLGREFEHAKFPECMKIADEFDRLVGELCKETK